MAVDTNTRKKEISAKAEALALKLGKAFRVAVLEPHLHTSEVVEEPEINKRTKVGKAEWAEFQEHHAGMAILKKSETDMVQAMADAVHNHPIASILVDPDGGPCEVSGFALDPLSNRLIRFRPDKWNTDHNIVVDLKSALDASYTGFGKGATDHRYGVSVHMTTLGMRLSGHPIDDYVFLAVEKEPPYGIGIYELDSKALEFGKYCYERDMAVYARCMDSGEWPCYPPEIRELNLPGWAYRMKVL